MTWTRRHLRLAIAIAAIGVALRVASFSARLPLSLDEAAIALNVQSRGWGALLGPLDHAQVAPPGFLVAEKAAVVGFGSSELALRSVPLAASILALGLCLALVRRVLGPVAGITALALTAFSRPLIEYAAVAKPYASDVAATFAIVLLVLHASRRTGTKPPAGAAAAAAVVALCSFTAVFTLTAAGAAALALAVFALGADERRGHARVAALWILAAVPAIVVGRLSLSPSDAEYMQWFWSSGFPPASLAEAPIWLWRRSVGLFGLTAGYRLATVWSAVAVIGLWSFWRRGRRDLALLAGFTVSVVIAASVARQYPFEAGRLVYFLLPLAFLLAGEGAGTLGSVAPVTSRWAALAPSIVMVVAALVFTMPPAPSAPPDDVRSFVEAVDREHQSGDAIYVYHWVGLPFLYYANRAGLSAETFTLGRCAHGSARSYFREIDALAGRARVWVALPHRRDPEIDAIRGYLDAVGKRRDALERGGLGYFYDLSPGAGRTSVGADRYPLLPALDGAEPVRWSCYGVFAAPSE